MDGWMEGGEGWKRERCMSVCYLGYMDTFTSIQINGVNSQVLLWGVRKEGGRK